MKHPTCGRNAIGHLLEHADYEQAALLIYCGSQRVMIFILFPLSCPVGMQM